MKVYVLSVLLCYGEYDKDDHEIIGVYKTLASANDAMRNDLASHWDEELNPEGFDECLADQQTYFDHATRNWKIEEHELED